MAFKRKQAAALRYDESKDTVPKLVAKGRGVVAEKIIEKALEHGIYIKEDKDLVEALSTLDLYDDIPRELYEIVAMVLAELYKINGKMKKANSPDAR